MKDTEDSQSVPEGHNILDLPFTVAHHAATGNTSVVYRTSNGGSHKSFLASTELVNGVWCRPVRISDLDTRKITSESIAHCYREDDQKRFLFRVGSDDTIHMRSEITAGAVWKDHGSITQKDSICERSNLAATSHGGTLLVYYVNANNNLTECWGTKTEKGIEWQSDALNGIDVDVSGQLAVTTVKGKTYIVFTASDSPCESIPTECRGALCLVVRTPTSSGSGWGKVHIIAAANQFSVETAVSITTARDIHEELTVCYLGDGSAAWTVQVGLNGVVVPRRDQKGILKGPERITRLTGSNSLCGTPGVSTGTSILYGMTTLHGTKTLMTFTKFASYEDVTIVTQRTAVEKWLKVELHERKREVSVLNVQLEINRARAEACTAARVEFELKLKIFLEEEACAVDEYKLTLSAYSYAETEYSKTLTAMTKITEELDYARIRRSTSIQSATWSICGTVRTEIRVLDDCGIAVSILDNCGKPVPAVDHCGKPISSGC